MTSMIVMTGASGFLGSHVYDLLSKAENEVHLIGRRREKPTDLSQHEPPWDCMSAPDVLLHCAGIMTADEQSVIGEAMMAVNLLRQLPGSVRRLVLVSTAYVYAPTTSNVGEETPPEPKDVYGHTKLMIEELFQAFAKATERDLIILRPCAIYGPGDPHRKVITAFITDARNGKAPMLKGSVTFPRDYIHVYDAARCIMAAINWMPTPNGGDGQDEKGTIVRVFNVCTGRAWSALDLALLIGRIKPELRVPADARENNALGYWFDPLRATRELGFTAEITLESAFTALLLEPAPDLRAQ